MARTTNPREPHPCIARRCGHEPTAHVRTPELEGAGETVLWCARCQRHEARSARRIWPARSAPVALPGPMRPF